MKKGFLILALLWCLGFATEACAETYYAPAALQPTEILRGQFTQTRRLTGFDKPLVSEGRFVIAPLQGLLWIAEKPFATVTVMTEAGLAQSRNGVRTMAVSAQKMPFVVQLYRMIGGVLKGDWSALQNEFALQQSGSPQQWTLRLVPRRADNAAMPFQEIKVQGGLVVQDVVMQRPNGDTDALSFTDVQLTQGALTDEEKALFAAGVP